MLFANLSFAAQLTFSEGVMIKDDKLLVLPKSNAGVLGVVKKGSVVAVIEKSGGWYKINSSGRQGWIKLLSLSPKRDSSFSFSSQDSVLNKKYDASKVVSVAGLRGMSEENLKEAAFNEREVSLMESHGARVTSDGARRFAQAGGLFSKAVVVEKKVLEQNALPSNNAWGE